MNYLPPKKVYNRVGWFFCGLLGVMLIMQVPMIILGVAINPKLLKNVNFLLIVNIVAYYVVAFPIYAVCMNSIEGKQKKEKGRLGFARFILLFLIAFSFMNIANLINIGFVELFHAVTGVRLKAELDDIMQEPSVMVVLTTSVLAPIFEELTFRYFALNKLRKYGDKTAILVTSILFGLFHMNFEQAIYAMAVGCVLGYVVCQTGRVVYSIGIHMLANFFGGVLPLFVRDYGNENLEIVYNASTILMVLLGVVLFITFRKKIRLSPATEYVQNPVDSFLINPGMLVFVITSTLIMCYSFVMKVITSVLV